ncbi:MAG: hypothetical protein A2Y94_05585 [Caldithrix sp. RBG_13_44_9]|nr:MAG: hypothetical protein A2Y94_05585 [Caldithrix sp. RBG_13_44_9]
MFLKIFLIPLITLLLILTGNTVWSKSFTIDKIDIQAEILPDGSMQLTEARTYTFWGEFSWADYRLPLANIGEIKDFTLRDETTEYQPDSDEKPGSYQLHVGSDEFYVRWNYRATNESRTFTLRYRITEPVTLYQDVAEFYFQFIGDANQKQIEEANISIQLPQPAFYPEVRAWAHGPLWGNVQFDNGKIVLTVSPLPANQFWEARVVFPLDWVPEEKRQIAAIQLSNILAEEDTWAKEANQKREKAWEEEQSKEEKKAQAWIFSYILMGIPPIIWLILFLKYGKGYTVPYYEKISSELPVNEPPAITGTFFHAHQVPGSAITATIFDLAHRGYLTIEQITQQEKKWWGTKKPEFALKLIYQQKADDNLLDFEKNLLDFIFNELGEGKPMVEFSVFKKRSPLVRGWFRQWSKIVKEHIKEQPLIEKKSGRATTYSLLCSLAAGTAGVLVVIFLGTPGILAIISGAIFFLLSFTIIRYLPEAKLRRRKLAALYKYLRKYYFLQDTERTIWPGKVDAFLIYGMALGIGNHVVEKMMSALTADQQTHYFPWYHYPPGNFTTPSDFASALTSMVTIASSTMSSSSGSGGGASGGGGGGGGGASGGAG